MLLRRLQQAPPNLEAEAQGATPLLLRLRLLTLVAIIAVLAVAVAHNEAIEVVIVVIVLLLLVVQRVAVPGLVRLVLRAGAHPPEAWVAAHALRLGRLEVGRASGTARREELGHLPPLAAERGVDQHHACLLREAHAALLEPHQVAPLPRRRRLPARLALHHRDEVSERLDQHLLHRRVELPLRPRGEHRLLAHALRRERRRQHALVAHEQVQGQP
mmetsp:Transcript_31926/g.95343  ORF Transcript_31926/g.95343 Transcript_31926/m.95343 type:complete len:216 (+) Transcript_31926:1574-2221(+)